MNEALVQHAEDQVDHDDRNDQQYSKPAHRILEYACAVPWNENVIVSGMPTSCAAFSIALVAWLKATPGFRLNEKFTAGS